MYDKKIKRILDVSIVVYGHSLSEIKSVLESLILSSKHAQIEALNVRVLDNKGCFDVKSLEAALNNDTFGFTINFEHTVRHDNPGYGVSNNISIFEDSGYYHLILNPDVIFDENAIEVAISQLEKNSNCILVSPKILDSKGKVLSGIKQYPSLLVLVLRFLDISIFNNIFRKTLNAYSCQDVLDSDLITSAKIASGCCMMCRKKDLIEVCGFDEDFFLYFEDFDLSLRLGEKGTIYYNPNFVIKHFGGNTGKKGVKHISFFLRSMVRFFHKHGIKWI